MRYFLLSLVVVLSACSTTSSGVSTSSTTTALSSATTFSSPNDTGLAPTTTVQSVSTSPLADLIKPIGSATYDPETLLATGPAPVGLHLETIGVDNAPVIPVGVLDNGEMEIPGAAEVGWYRFGPSPGEHGSAVLAAHIAYNGRNGLFRKLDQMQLGDSFEVAYDDGTTSRFEVTEIAQYGKTELPFDRIFAKDGEAGLVLITCGGSFNESLRSYDDNIVVYAVPSA